MRRIVRRHPLTALGATEEEVFNEQGEPLPFDDPKLGDLAKPV